jgi:hypothetical protein
VKGHLAKAEEVSVTSHAEIRLRNQGWRSATNYLVEIAVTGNITACYVFIENSYSQRYDCSSVLPSGFQPCGSENMLILSGVESVLVSASTFPVGCDLTVSIDWIAPYPIVQVSGKSDETSIETLALAGPQIDQRDFSLWVFASVVVVLIVVSGATIVSRLRRKGQQGQTKTKRESKGLDKFLILREP